MTVSNTWKCLRTFVRDLVRQVVARIEHREQHAVQQQAGIQGRAHALDRADQIRQAFERVVLGLHRYEHQVGGDQRIDRQDAERGGTVDEDEIVVSADRFDRLAQAQRAILGVDELDLDARQIATRRARRAGTATRWAARCRAARLRETAPGRAIAPSCGATRRRRSMRCLADPRRPAARAVRRRPSSQPG